MLGQQYQAQLQQGLDSLGLSLSQTQIAKLHSYLLLFEKWNKAFNLSAIRDMHAMVSLHLLDSLAVAPHLQGRTWLDVGTGGGLPGIPLAITFPDYHFTLLDSAGKKTRFLHQIVQSLALENVTVINDRVEAVSLNDKVDGIISRAFASLTDMIQCCQHLLGEGGSFWAMKGQIPHAELREIEKDYIVSNVIPLSVPGVEAERCLVVIRPQE